MTPPDSTSALAHAAAPPVTRDAVTGLPDRASFSALTHWHCALAAQTETGLAVLAVIWDQAAAMRATFSPALWDAARAALAGRLRGGICRGGDTLGDLGGGVVGALLPFTDAAGAGAVARRWLGLITPAPDTAGHHQAILPAGARLALTGSLSIGIASYGGRGQVDAARLIEAAERACETAHVDGGNKAVRRDVALAPARP